MLQASSPGRCRYLALCVVLLALLLLSACGSGSAAPPGGSQTSGSQTTSAAPTVTLIASATNVTAGGSLTLTVTAANATQVVISNNINSTTDTLAGTGGSYSPSPTATTIYTATAANGSVTATATVTVTVTVNTSAGVGLINHVIFLMQENRTFDTYFGMLNKYRASQSTSGQAWNIGDDGTEYDVDGIAGTNGVVATTFTPNKTDVVTCPATGQYGTPPITCTPASPVPGLDGSPIALFKFATACVDDMTSDWLGSYGDVSPYDFTPTRTSKPMMGGFVHIAYNYAKGGSGSGIMTDDPNGQRAMGYYDQVLLNYYYYMASQFALSDRWFSPVSSKSTPNRIATLTGGTTQGLVYDPFVNDDQILKNAGLPANNQLAIPTIFSKLDKAGVSWRIYYGATNSGSAFPQITFSDFTDSYKYLYTPATGATCAATTTTIGSGTSAFCMDTTRITPVSQYFTDIASGTTCTLGQAGNCLPNFAFIEPNYGTNDEHPGSGQSILSGQAQVASLVNALMNSPSWKDSVFFLSYDEGGGPFDHVPPLPNHSNAFTSPATGIASGVNIPDISSIAVNPDTYFPCPAKGPVGTGTQPTPTLYCDLQPRGTFDDPGYLPGDDAAINGFAAQLGFRLPNMVISPFTRRHYVSHIPMDHTAILKFVEDRFIKDGKYLTLRDAAQPNLLDFFDFVNVPWATPPATSGIPTPVAPTSATCTPATMH